MTDEGLTGHHPIAAFIAHQPGMAARLLRDHGDDGTGHCRVCAAGGQAGRQVFPCRLREFAESAATLDPHRPR